MRVLFLLTDHFYDDDFLELYKRFDQDNYDIKVATPKGYSVTGIKNTKIMPDYKFEDLSPYKQFDIAILISYYDYESFNVIELKELIGYLLTKGTVVAIRTAPIFLAEQKLIKGKKTTWDYLEFPQFEQYLRDHGVNTIKTDLFFDGNYISSRGCCYDLLYKIINLKAKGFIL
ncbi:NEQ343 [Nanoarchaeum equitans Kin4-M]|uniref:NEQ343 n=1 Tax=Nanoarchaeum equitans (strain Kin4-M) TaxID=228908 RepID=Q74MA8_NANEQ|nr:NEQ343 [Nanoarchaeum equitans Kin4-M]